MGTQRQPTGFRRLSLRHARNLSSAVLILFISTLLCNVNVISALDTSTCTSPMGMESFDIQDTDVTASSSFDAGNVGPQNARVRVERQGGAWCPKNQITSDAEEWLQIDLHTVHVITGTETQGRFGNGQGQEFTEKYILSYWRPELGRWVRYRDSTGNEILKANINTYLAFKTELSPPIFASKLRFLPYSLHRRTVCLRVEIYGCAFRGGLISYSMLQGSKRGDNWNFYDQTYDGTWEGNQLKNGLGLLTDGRGGPHNFKDDYYGHERGKGWVGWKNDSRHSNSPIEITFKFDAVREFSAVHIHTSNQFTKDVQVFSEARIYFSIGGQLYPGDPITYITMEDCIFEDPKNISIPLHHRAGQYVKVQLFWATKWMMISEVTFDSQPAMGNFTAESTTPAVVPNNPTNSLGDDVLAGSKSSSVAVPGGGNSLQTQSDASDGTITDSRNHQYHHDSNAIGQQQQSTISATSIANNNDNPNTSSGNNGSSSSSWSVATIVMTAIISSFVAILMVLLFILSALVIRNKLSPNSVKSNSASVPNPYHHHHHVLGTTTLPYDTVGPHIVCTNQNNEYGIAGECYMTPGEIRKCKLTATLGRSGGGGLADVNSGVEYQEPFSTTTQIGTYHHPSPGILASFPGANQTVVAATMKGNHAEYYSCTIVPNGVIPVNNTDSSNEYEYAVPNELGKLLPPPPAPAPTQQQQQQLISPQLIKSIPNSPAINNGTRASSRSAASSSSSSASSHASSSAAIQLKFRELGISEIPKERLRMLRKLGDGAFGTVYIGEIEDDEKKNLVAVKHLLRNATEKDKCDFLEEIRLLSSLNDPNVAQVLGVSTEDEPYSVVLEFLELGDLCQFLRQNDALLPSGVGNQKLSSSSLIYMASQIASGMRFLESRNIVHRDLATRNCIVGHGLLVKVSHFATDTDLYSSHYYRLDGKMPLPIRWMAWESLFLGKYSTKSDVWSFGITLWEILSFARHSPYSLLTNQEVLANIRKLSTCSQTDPFEPLSKPGGCPRDIYQLMTDTWRRNDEERPTFWEINSFLTRKILNFIPPQPPPPPATSLGSMGCLFSNNNSF